METLSPLISVTASTLITLLGLALYRLTHFEPIIVTASLFTLASFIFHVTWCAVGLWRRYNLERKS